jgi:hypothetical protein
VLLTLQKLGLTDLDIWRSPGRRHGACNLDDIGDAPLHFARQVQRFAKSGARLLLETPAQIVKMEQLRSIECV